MEDQGAESCRNELSSVCKNLEEGGSDGLELMMGMRDILSIAMEG